LWAEATGKIDMAANVDMQACNLFYMASITKTFTAVAALRLQEKGVLRIDDQAIKYLPELADIPYGDKITIRQLLNHTSGIGGDGSFVKSTFDYFNFSNAPVGVTLEERLRMMKKARFEPGTSWEYSYGADLVGLIMARATGKSSGYRVIEDEVLVPLGLRNTFLNDKAHPAGLPKKYMDMQANGKIIELKVPFRPVKDGSLDFASGGGISSAHDLMKFADALFKGNFLRPESLRQMKQTVPIPDGLTGWENFPAYGVGLSVLQTPYGQALGHEGDMFGGSAFMYHFPEHDVTIVGAMNVTSYPLRQVFSDYQELSKVLFE
jgi:D-alanyl-D-alanine carboxypeptidase